MMDKKITCKVRRNARLCGVLCQRCLRPANEECPERFEILEQVSIPSDGDYCVILVDDITRFLVREENVYDVKEVKNE